MGRIIQKDNKIKYCNQCKVELTEKNWFRSFQDMAQYMCKDCSITRTREYGRKHIISNGNCRIFGINKKEYVNNCELCGISFDNIKSAYHHWDDNFPQLGIWVCNWCHKFVEQYDKEYGKKYIQIKIKLAMKLINSRAFQRIQNDRTSPTNS